MITPDLVLTEGSARTSEVEKLLDLPFRESVLAWERMLIDHALEAANGNKAEAARRLGIHRRLLYEKLGTEES